MGWLGDAWNWLTESPGPAGFMPELDPDALKDLQELSFSSVKMPGSADYFSNVSRGTSLATNLMNPIQSAMTANAGRAIQAQVSQGRQALAGSLGSGVGTAARARVGQLANAGIAESGERIAGAVAGETGRLGTQMGAAATGFDMDAALAEIQSLIAGNSVARENLLAKVNQSNMARGLIEGLPGSEMQSSPLGSLYNIYNDQQDNAKDLFKWLF